MDLRVVVFIVYLLVMLAIGVYFYRKNRSNSDYILGGRSLNVWVAAMSAQASDMSGWLLMGLPGLAIFYLFKDGTASLSYNGLYEAAWTAIGLALGTYLNWLIVAKRLRVFTKYYNDSITLPDFFENRFNDKTKVLRTISAVFTLIFFAIYTAAQFSAGAKLFLVVFSVEYHTALIIATFVIVSYTFLGGFLAVCWTDLVQGILMFFALIVVPIVAFIQLGGSQGVSSAIHDLSASIGVNEIPGTAGVVLIISALAWGLGYFGQPHILARFMGIKSPAHVRPARIIAMIWVLISLFCAVVIGFLGAPYLFKTGANLNEAGAIPENIFITLSNAIFSTETLGTIAGPIIVGLLMTAVLAAIMSTADSQLLVASSAFSGDIYPQFKKGVTDKESMWVSRISVIAITLVAAVIAWDRDSSVFRIVQDAWAGFGAAFGPLVLFSIFWKRANSAGAIAGVLSGGLVALLWKPLFANVPVLRDVYSLLPGFAISAILIVAVSLATSAPSKEEYTKFDLALKSEL